MELAAATRRPPDLVPFDLADCLRCHCPATTTKPLLLPDVWSNVAMLLLEQSRRRNLPSLTCSTTPPSINCSSTMPSPAQRSCNLRFGELPHPSLPSVGHRTRGMDSGTSPTWCSAMLAEIDEAAARSEGGGECGCPRSWGVVSRGARREALCFASCAG